jgi:hypothetical protein
LVTSSWRFGYDWDGDVVKCDFVAERWVVGKRRDEVGDVEAAAFELVGRFVDEFVDHEAVLNGEGLEGRLFFGCPFS